MIKREGWWRFTIGEAGGGLCAVGVVDHMAKRARKKGRTHI